MYHFFNSKEDIVQDAVEGIVSASGGSLVRLDGFPHIRVVVRADWDHTKVAVISGGGSGHEPSHAGFVGEGMLTAAVCGDVFASPSVDAVLAGILSVTGPAGCLLIVKNYTGDRLNFGFAAERARAFGIKVNMIIVEDDISLPELSKPRGIAGTLFVHKIAGAVSESGGTLEDVTSAANRVKSSVMTIGMSLDTCTVPGSTKEDRIAPNEIELGLGIHGEAGAEHIPYLGAKQAISDAVSKLKHSLKGGKYVALINNLGGATDLEMSVLTKELINSEIGNHLSHIVGPAAMMTALDMHGFSISLYPISEQDEAHLALPVSPNAWPGLRPLVRVASKPLPERLLVSEHPSSDHPETARFLTQCCQVFISAESDLNALDAKTGDGDTGTTLATAARAMIDSIDRLPLADATSLCQALGQQLSQTMGGSSGILLAIFFSATGDAMSSGHDLISALNIGLARLKEVGGAQIGDRTMVDALEPALSRLQAGFAEAAEAARKGAVSTASMTEAHAGRSSYLSSEQLAGVIDPGAEAVARLFEAIARQFGRID